MSDLHKEALAALGVLKDRLVRMDFVMQGEQRVTLWQMHGRQLDAVYQSVHLHALTEERGEHDE